MFQPIRGQGGHLGFPIGHLVEDVEVSSKSVQWFWRNSKKNVTANQRSGLPSWISNRHKNTNLKDFVEDLLPVKYRQNRFKGCGEEVEKCFSQSEARAAILDFLSARKKKQKLYRGRWGLASCQVSSKSAQWFWRSRKMFQPIRGQDGQLVSVYANHFYDTSVIFRNSIITYREPFTICIGIDCCISNRHKNTNLKEYLED